MNSIIRLDNRWIIIIRFMIITKSESLEINIPLNNYTKIFETRNIRAEFVPIKDNYGRVD